MSKEYEQKYTVCLQGREFTLRRSQIEFDSPNYFTSCFLGNFHEAETRRIELDRDPDLFQIVISYLNGYVVLPLNDKSLPGGASLRPTLLNLRADAQFYQLDGLLKACDEELDRRKNRYIVLGFEYQLTDVDFEELHYGSWSFLKAWPAEAKWQTYVTEDSLGHGPLEDLKRPEPSDKYELERMAAIERLASRSIKDYDPRRHILVGWNQKENCGNHNYTDYDVHIVYEDREPAH